MRLGRSSGILLHPTSLPGRFGIGDLGESARRFVDFLVAGAQSLWQVLPLGPTGYGDSPYQSFSAFAGNTLLISPDQLVTCGVLSDDDIAPPPAFAEDRIDFGGVIDFKSRLLETAFANLKQSGPAELRSELQSFCEQAGDWLDDYASFRAIKEAHGGAAWNAWDEGLALREPGALGAARSRLRDRIDAQKFFQFLFFKQWRELKSYCHDRGVRIIGDVPIFVAYDSADVWAHPDMFKLEDSLRPVVVAGVPPDYFSRTGQLWGNPIYDWDRVRADGYRWWIRRMQATLQVVDIVRIDHFRGFAASWEVPGGDETAERGQWVDVPGYELFAALKDALGELPIIAEDLGLITPDVEELRDYFGFPGMRVLQFAFRDRTNSDLPHNYVRNSVVYTGTHDNDTAVGWLNSAAGVGSTRDADQIQSEREYCLEYLNSDGSEIHWDFIRAGLASVADAAIIPLQDVLGLGSSARMNLPASGAGNWSWRFSAEMITDEAAKRLRKLTETYVRNSL